MDFLGSIRMKTTVVCAGFSYIFSSMEGQAENQGILQSCATLTALLKWHFRSCNLTYYYVSLRCLHHSQDSLFGLSI